MLTSLTEVTTQFHGGRKPGASLISLVHEEASLSVSHDTALQFVRKQTFIEALNNYVDAHRDEFTG
jgi:hypothetical protein